MPRDVETTFNYYKGTVDGDLPFNYVSTPPEGKLKSNIEVEAIPATVHDVRGRQDQFGLDVTGFAFLHAPSKERLFTDEEAIRSGYYKEVEALLKREVKDAKRIFIFDHTIRKPPPKEEVVDKDALRGPVERVHVDQTFEAGIGRVRHHLGEEADRLLQGRARIINVWRPIGNTVAHHPLGVADWRTLDVADLISTRHIYNDREGSTFSVKHKPGQQWYYLGDQTPDEVTLIKCFDSDESVARLTPHSAFVDKTSPPNAPQRQSIEVRCLVFDRE